MKHFHSLFRYLSSFLLTLVLYPGVSAGQPAQIMLVDGTTTEGEFLFQHPNAPLLIFRSSRNSTLQSFHEKDLYAVKIGGQIRQFSPRRTWTPKELEAWQATGLWVDQAEEGRINNFANETWETKEVAVWAHPGKSGNFFDAANWLDTNGNVHTAPPFQDGEDVVDAYGRKKKEGLAFDGDVLLPRAEESYSAIQEGKRDGAPAIRLRHLTVERNAVYHARWDLRGNLWVKTGGDMFNGVQTGDLGAREVNKHTVARFGQIDFPDLPDWIDPDPKINWAYSDPISHWVWINTGDKGSLEVIGISRGPTDRIELVNGTLIISRDSYLGNGNRATYSSQKGTTTILLDGARIGSPHAITGGSGGKTMGTYSFDGKVLFGTPELPLTRNLSMGLCYYPKDLVSATTQTGPRGSGAALVVGKNGELVVHSSDPKTVKVLFHPHPKSHPMEKYKTGKERRDLVGTKEQLSFWDDTGFYPGTAAVFHGKTDFNGVGFDGFYPKGIMVAPAQRSAWRNVSFGPNNLAPPEELFMDL